MKTTVGRIVWEREGKKKMLYVRLGQNEKTWCLLDKSKITNNVIWTGHTSLLWKFPTVVDALNAVVVKADEWKKWDLKINLDSLLHKVTKSTKWTFYHWWKWQPSQEKRTFVTLLEESQYQLMFLAESEIESNRESNNLRPGIFQLRAKFSSRLRHR